MVFWWGERDREIAEHPDNTCRVYVYIYIHTSIFFCEIAREKKIKETKPSPLVCVFPINFSLKNHGFQAHFNIVSLGFFVGVCGLLSTIMRTETPSLSGILEGTLHAHGGVLCAVEGDGFWWSQVPLRRIRQSRPLEIAQRYPGWCHEACKGLQCQCRRISLQERFSRFLFLHFFFPT